MNKKFIIITGLILMYALQSYSQISKSFTITLNNDNSPIEAILKDKKIVVNLKKSDVVNFVFGQFTANSENVTIIITNQITGDTILYTNTNDLKKKNKFDLKVFNLNLSDADDDEIYLVSLTDVNIRQLICRFKVTD